MSDRAALYARLSDPNARDAPSLDVQERQCREYCARRGYAVTVVLRENFTGSVLRERPEIRRVIGLIEQRAIDVVVIRDLERFGREQASFWVFRDICQQRGVRVEFALEEFEDTSIGKFMLNAKAFAHELERERIAWRTQSGKRRLVEAGFPYVGWKTGYGWVRQARKMAAPYAPHPEEAAVVARIFREAAAGVHARIIARTLQAEGIPTPSGRGEWHHNTILRLLKNPAYYGSPASYRTKTERIPGKQRPVQRQLPQEEWVAAGTLPALVDRATWDAANRWVLANRHAPPKTDAAPLLLRGRVFCGACGGPLSTACHPPTATGFQYWYYRCMARRRVGAGCASPVTIGAVRLDAAAWADVVRELQPARLRARLAATAPEPVPAPQRKDDRAALERQVRNLTASLALTDSPEGQAPIVAAIGRLTARLRALEDSPPPVAVTRTDRARLAQRLIDYESEVGAALEAFDFAQRRNAVKLVGLQATIAPREGKTRPAPAFRYTLLP